MISNFIQYIMKENVLLLKNLLEPYRSKFISIRLQYEIMAIL